MNDFITIAIAHDATCEPGEEWLFPGMSGSKDGDSDWEPSNVGCGCLMAFVAIVICFVIWAIWRLI